MANTPYAAADWEDFERHGTVFHYRSEGLATKNRLTYPEFVGAFDEEHAAGKRLRLGIVGRDTGLSMHAERGLTRFRSITASHHKRRL